MKHEENTESTAAFYKQIVHVHEDYYQFWKEHTLFHWEWWFSLALAIIPWLIWMKVHQKESRNRMLYVAFFLIIISSSLDLAGVILGLWYYEGKVLPIFPTYIPWDFCLIPVTMTLLIQYKPHIAPWKKAIFFGALTSFIGEPFFAIIDLYKMVHWEHLYSFPIYITLYLAADRLSKAEHFSPLT